MARSSQSVRISDQILKWLWFLRYCSTWSVISSENIQPIRKAVLVWMYLRNFRNRKCSTSYGLTLNVAIPVRSSADWSTNKLRWSSFKIKKKLFEICVKPMKNEVSHQLKIDDQTSLQRWTNHGRWSSSLLQEFTKTVSSSIVRILYFFS